MSSLPGQPLDKGTPEPVEMDLQGQSQFTCSICAKIFANRLSRNRHVLYCRQKQLKQNYGRKKSCTRCRRAKTRCSETIPQCTRCKVKGLYCEYDSEHRIASASQMPGLDKGLSRNQVGVAPAGSLAETATLAAQLWQTSLPNSGHEDQPQVDFQLNSLASSRDVLPVPQVDHEIDFDWDLQVPQYEGIDNYFDSNHLDQIAQDMCNAAHQLTVSSFPEASSQMKGYVENESSTQPSQVFLQRSSYLDTTDAEMSLLSARAAQIEPISSTAPKIGLFRRRRRSFGSQLSAYYLVQTLRSYPKMMLSKTLPPFIHENSGQFGNRGFVAGSMHSPSPLLLEPLAICKSIMCMYFSKTSESTSFVWRTIEMELNRLDMEFQTFDEWSLMSALQALTIYILVATNEDDNLSPSIDARILHVMMSVAAKIEKPNYMYGIAKFGEWEEWALQESRDRTFTLLFIINKFFDINPTHDPNVCNAILAMPVPTHKSLWEATDYLGWKEVHAEFLQKREGRPSLTYRDMVTFHQQSQTGQNQTLGDLDDWFLNLDAFGTFVLMTATSI